MGLSESGASRRSPGAVGLGSVGLGAGLRRVEFSPFEFLDRLAVLVPPPRKIRHRYHGVFAPNHKLRPTVTALAIGRGLARDRCFRLTGRKEHPRVTSTVLDDRNGGGADVRGRSAHFFTAPPGAETMNVDSHHDSLLRAAVQDRPTVTEAGQLVRRLTDGVRIRSLPTHFDQRGSVTELFDLRWHFHPDPLVFAYCFTIRPGVVKGWNLHQRHEDRYALIKGELELVLYDPRETSPTFKEVCVIRISEASRVVVTVPINVWHADFNVGAEDVIVANFPTMAYDHADPDKWRLPIDTPLIPYSFPAGVRGG